MTEYLTNLDDHFGTGLPLETQDPTPGVISGYIAKSGTLNFDSSTNTETITITLPNGDMSYIAQRVFNVILHNEIRTSFTQVIVTDDDRKYRGGRDGSVCGVWEGVVSKLSVRVGKMFVACTDDDQQVQGVGA